MANEYLRRNFTSTGNLREGTFSFWMKGRPFDTNQTRPVYLYDGSNLFQVFFERTTGTNPGQIVVYGAGADIRYKGIYRDPSAWSHYLIKVDNTINGAEARFEVFVNGVRLEIVGSQSTTSAVYPTRDANVFNNVFYINGTGNGAFQVCDYFYVDGQALTPDVFGFYKTGKGYISVGSTQATDFRPGQWVPKSPRIIIADINSRGGFGVNGFYLPMNDSNNFGADFHCTPNSIIKLQENLPQPKSRIDGVGNYTGALRDDPFKQYLVLALPFVSNGLQNGFGDYSAAIKGSGTPKTLTLNGGIVTSSTHSYYGSAGYFNNGGTSGSQFLNCTDSDFALGTSNFTLEAWIYPTSIYNYWTLLSTRPSDGAFGDAYHIGTDANGTLGFYSNEYDARSANGIIIANQWSHIAACRIGNTLTLYVNGVAVAVNPNYTKNLTRNALSIGRLQNFGTNFESATGYIQDLRIYKGVAKYTGGFDVPRPYTPVGIATWRAVPDTTANNYATLNGVVKPSKYTVSNGNLTFTNSTTNWTGWLEGTVGFSTGKYYWETRIDVSTDYHHIGIVGVGITHFNSTDTYFYGVSYQTDGRFWAERNTGTAFAYSIPTAKTVGDIVQVAVDMSNKRMWIGKNGTWFSGDPSNGSSPPFNYTVGFNYTHYVPFYDSYGSSGLSINFGQNPTFSGNTTAGTFTDSSGKGLFKYQPPAGFLALCEDNLPAPTISDPGKHFKTVLWTGDGNNGRSIGGVGFQPDLVWIKDRNNGGYNHLIIDSVRGAGFALRPSSTNEETSSGIRAFNADGFSISSEVGYNLSGNNHVAWCWKAGNTSTTNTNGSITSTVSVNQQAGFSIVSWTGNGASTVTVGHGLGKTPAFMILKARDAGSADSSWVIFHKSMGSGTFDKYMYFNTGGAGTLVPSLPANSNIFTSSNPGINSNNIRYITYCWAEIEGYSKFGSYVGNGDFDGPFVYCGFKPAWIMIKSINNENGWIIMDNARKPINPNGEVLFANDAMAEQTDLSYRQTDFLSNGFKIRAGIGSERNSSGTTYIFVAFAESPFQTANSK
jgi:hypothetical protein